MNPDFILKHIPLGSFVKVSIVGEGSGSSFGTMVGADDEAIAVQSPERDGSGSTVIPHRSIETILSGEAAEACNLIADKGRGSSTFTEALSEIRRQKQIIAEHAAE